MNSIKNTVPTHVVEPKGHKSRPRPGTFPSGVLLDERDVERVRFIGWWHIDNKGYVTAHTAERRITLLHREIMEAPIGFEVDHINGNPLDNRRHNLRVVSHAQNISNRTRLNRNNTSGYRGVSPDARGKGWTTRVKIAGVAKYLGCYRDKLLAAAVVATYRAIHMPGAAK